MREAYELRARQRVTAGQPDRLLGRVFRVKGQQLDPTVREGRGLAPLLVYVSAIDDRQLKLLPCVNGVPDDRPAAQRIPFTNNVVSWTLFEALLEDVLEEA